MWIKISPLILWYPLRLSQIIYFCGKNRNLIIIWFFPDLDLFLRSKLDKNLYLQSIVMKIWINIFGDQHLSTLNKICSFFCIWGSKANKKRLDCFIGQIIIKMKYNLSWNCFLIFYFFVVSVFILILFVIFNYVLDWLFLSLADLWSW